MEEEAERREAELGAREKGGREGRQSWAPERREAETGGREGVRSQRAPEPSRGRTRGMYALYGSCEGSHGSRWVGRGAIVGVG